MNHTVTIFKNITATSTGFNRSVEFVFDRIRQGKSKELLSRIRLEDEKEVRNQLKMGLPSICFSGTFNTRNAAGLVKHSGLICLDFDGFEDDEVATAWRDTLTGWEYTYALFTSPSGNGLKVLVRIPETDAEGHKEYFEAIEQHWDECQYFDRSTSDVCRVCYESYDPDLYVNTEADIWHEKAAKEIQDIGTHYALIPQKSDTVIISTIQQWWEKKKKGAGKGRNADLFVFASALNRFGVNRAATEQHLSQFAVKDFPQSEIMKVVKSAYKNTGEHGTQFLEDKQAHAQFEKQIRAGKTVKAIAKELDLSEEIAEEVSTQVRETLAISDFWAYNEKGKVVLSPHKYKFFLEQNQFCKFFPEGSAAYLFVRINSNLLEDTAAAYMKDFVLSYLLDRADIGYAPYDFMANQTRLFKDDYLSMLDTAEVRLKKDTEDTCYLYFSNCAVEVGRNTVTTIDYLDLDGFVWKKHVIDRDFKGVGTEGGMFEKFLRLAAGRDEKRFNSLRSVAGYLLHSYKTSANNKAIIMNDELISENPNGGSGKGMFCNAIGRMKRTATLDGKQFSFEKSFPYQTVGADTQVLVFDDVRKNFAFEQLFSLITEGITLEKKNKDAIHIPVSRSPKLVITTNYTIGGIGGSFERRKFEVEFSSYFGAHRTPFDEFGCMLFDDWKADEWARFDSFMIGCVQYYLNHGLVAHESVNLDLRKFIKETCSEFVEWATLENLPLRQRLDKGAMFTAFISEYKDYERTLSQKKFTQWMDIYGKKNGYNVTQGKSGALRWIHFDDGNGPKQSGGLDLSSDEIDPLA
jgi:hypothetical protein